MNLPPERLLSEVSVKLNQIVRSSGQAATQNSASIIGNRNQRAARTRSA